MASPTPEELNKQFEKLQRLATTLGKNLNNFNLRPVAEDATLIGELIEKWGDELDDSLSSVKDLASGFQSVVQEISKGNIGLNSTKKTFNSLTSIAQQLSYDQAGINKLSEKELQTLLKKSQQSKQDAKTNNDILEQRKASLIAENTSDAISLEQKKKNRVEIAQINGVMIDNQSIINEESQSYKDLNTAIRSRLELEEKIGKTMGITGAAVDGVENALDKIGLGGLGRALGLDTVKDKMKEISEETAKGENYTGGFADKMKVLKGGVQEAGKQFVKSLKDPAAITGLLIKEMVDALVKGDAATGELAKDFNMTYAAASNLRNELNDIANLSMDVNITTKGLQESMVAVGKTLGSNAKLNDADLITFTKLREQAGYTNEELASIQTLSLANGKSLEDNTAEILGSAEAYASQNKLIVNEKEVLKEVGKASASLKLSLGGSTAALAESVVKAKQFGLNLEQASRISSGLLNFEESISSEIEAELLTGKELNLEQARLLALNGKTAEAAAEVAKQVGSSAQFGKMNVIQQEAIAKSVGMSRDELAQSLIDKEALNKLSGVEGKDAKEKFDNLVKQVGMEEAKKRLGDEQLANQFAQQSVQERFNKTVEKLREVFVSLAQPILELLDPIMEVVNAIMPLVNIILYPLTNGIKAIGKFINTFIKEPIEGVKQAFSGVLDLLNGDFEKGFSKIGKGLLKGLLTPITSIISGFDSLINGVINLINKIPGVKIGAVDLTSEWKSITSINDGIIDPKGGLVVSGEKGTYKLNENDSIIAGTDLNKPKKSSSLSSTSISQNDKNISTQTQPQLDLSPLMERINVLIDAVKAGGNVYLDGTKVGTAMAVGTYKIQ
jgi:hypothetical protein